MAKAKTQPEAEEPKDFGTSDQPMTKSEADAAPKSEAPVKPKKAKQTSFTVYKNGSPVRTYSVEQHGEEAEALAHEFCAHSGDQVL